MNDALPPDVKSEPVEVLFDDELDVLREDGPCLDYCQQARLASIRSAMLRKPQLWEDFKKHTGHGNPNDGKPVAFRTLDWFVTNFSRGRHVLVRGKDVYAEYKTRLRCFHKDFFDPFRRGAKIRFHPEGDDRPDAVVTALCQLNFFIWAIESGVVDECETRAGEVEQERREANRLKRKRQIDALINGRQHKRSRLVDYRGAGMTLGSTGVKVDWQA